MELRPYQNDAVQAIVSSMFKYDRVLLSLPVGLGKTVIGAYLVDAWKRELHQDFNLPPRVLWLAHRDELIWQAVKTIRQFTGEDPAVEKAGGPASPVRAGRIWDNSFG